MNSEQPNQSATANANANDSANAPPTLEAQLLNRLIGRLGLVWDRMGEADRDLLTRITKDAGKLLTTAISGKTIAPNELNHLLAQANNLEVLLGIGVRRAFVETAEEVVNALAKVLLRLLRG